MKENFLTITGKKEVRDTNKNLHFTIANSKVEILDAAGGPVCMLVSKVFTIRNTTYLCPGNSTDTDGHLLRARKLLFTIAPVLEVFLRGNNSDNPDMILSGSIFNYDFKVSFCQPKPFFPMAPLLFFHSHSLQNEHCFILFVITH
ncbi:unnamed protein product [Closterium sp. Naga37s-1]|nr:unnamed protein product [Closterium sp. Naga37s-1]